MYLSTNKQTNKLNKQTSKQTNRTEPKRSESDRTAEPNQPTNKHTPANIAAASQLFKGLFSNWYHLPPGDYCKHVARWYSAPPNKFPGFFASAAPSHLLLPSTNAPGIFREIEPGEAKSESVRNTFKFNMIGGVNPLEKYVRHIESFPRGSGEKYEIFETSTLFNIIGFCVLDGSTHKMKIQQLSSSWNYHSHSTIWTSIFWMSFCPRDSFKPKMIGNNYSRAAWTNQMITKILSSQKINFMVLTQKSWCMNKSNT